MTVPNRNSGPQIVAGSGPARKTPGKSDAAPIWLSALCAARCNAVNGSQERAVRWDCISGRAVYTNAGAHPERIEPLGVNLQTGQTLAVYWMPGETSYTLEVYGQTEMCA